MKKVLALALCVATLFTCLIGCEFAETEKKQEDKGATIELYMTSPIYNFDPIQAHIDEAAQQIMGLLYEGLFTLNKDGKRVKAGAKSWKVVDNDKNHYIDITIRESYWSDGRQVTAQDYVYTFKRAIESDSANAAAAMLMDIRNAYDIKHQTGDKPLSIDDLGVTDVGVDVLRIEFDYTVDYEQFLDYLASPLLYPVREDIVGKAEEWASNSSIVVFNGPFFIRNFDPKEMMTLERNSYYNRDIEDDSIKKAVTPYRLKINLTKNCAENYADFEAGTIYYMGELPIEQREALGDKIEVVETGTMSQMTLLFNTKDELMSSAKVRRALSIAINRQELADKIVFAKPATNIVGSGVYETTAKNKTLFSEVSGELFPAGGDVAAAKKLLQEAGVSGGTIKISYRAGGASDEAAFEYIKGVWESLGFTVEGRAYTVEDGADTLFTHEVDKNEYDLYWNNFYHAYQKGDFQVMIYDMMMFSTDPFSTLAPFALEFSGNKVEMASSDATETGDETVSGVIDGMVQNPHVSGFNNETYNKLIAEAFAIKTDSAERSAKLHDAEKLLAEECPVAPLVEHQRYYIVSDELDKLSVTSFGITEFKKAKLKVYDPDTTIEIK